MDRWRYKSRESLVKPEKKIYNLNKDRNDRWGERLKQSLLLNDIKDEEMEMKRLNEPIRFIAPYAEGKRDGRNESKADKSGLNRKNNEINLMELNTSRGKQEIKTDPKGENISFTATAKRPNENGLLNENMRVFNRDTAKKQRRISDINLFLARGKKEDAASVEFELSREWTDQRMKLVQGEGRSRMLEVMCPYADDTKERTKMLHIKQELEAVRNMRILLESQSSQEADLTGSGIEDLKRQEDMLRSRLEKLSHLMDKKDYIKRIMLQKYKYAVHPTRDRKFFAGFRSDDTLYNKAASAALEMEETDQTNNSNLISNIFDSEESNTDLQFGDGSEE